jgi:hypothetical protein
VCAGLDGKEGVRALLRDPLIRLVMSSDGVTEQAMIALLDQLRQSLAEREHRHTATRASRCRSQAGRAISCRY